MNNVNRKLWIKIIEKLGLEEPGDNQWRKLRGYIRDPLIDIVGSLVIWGFILWVYLEWFIN